MRKKLIANMLTAFAAAVMVVSMQGLKAEAKWLPEKNYECEEGAQFRPCDKDKCWCYGTPMTATQKASVVEKVEQIMASAPGTNHEKAKYFHDTICNTTSYKVDSSYEIANPYGVLINGQAKCAGYAETFKMLCDVAGIPCYTVDGYGKSGPNNEPHRWNIVQLEDGQWYEVDCTFDDTYNNSKISYKWFLLTTEQMNSDHTRKTPSYATEPPVAYGTTYAYKEPAQDEEKKQDENDSNKKYAYFNYKGSRYYIDLRSVQANLISIPSNVNKFTVPDTIPYRGKKYPVTKIEPKAVTNKNAKKLKHITIGKNVIDIYDKAFYKCTTLKTLTFKANYLDCYKHSFYKLSPNITVKVHAKVMKYYKRELKKAGLSKAKFKKY